MSVEGYGISSETFQYVDNIVFVLYDKIAEQDSYLKQAYDDFTILNREEYLGNFEDLLDAFFDSYENDIYYWWGIEGAITDYIDQEYFGGRNLLRYEDYCFYVSASDATDAGISTEEIDSILREAFSPFVIGGEVEPTWLDIQA